VTNLDSRDGQVVDYTVKTFSFALLFEIGNVRELTTCLPTQYLDYKLKVYRYDHEVGVLHGLGIK
jgi:hypothetical protein